MDLSTPIKESPKIIAHSKGPIPEGAEGTAKPKPPAANINKAIIGEAFISKAVKRNPIVNICPIKYKAVYKKIKNICFASLLIPIPSIKLQENSINLVDIFSGNIENTLLKTLCAKDLLKLKNTKTIIPTTDITNNETAAYKTVDGRFGINISETDNITTPVITSNNLSVTTDAKTADLLTPSLAPSI